MEHVVEYLNFSEELKLAIENDIFNEFCILSLQDKQFIFDLINHHPNIILEILTMKIGFHSSSIPFLVDKVSTQIINLTNILNPITNINIFNIIQFICYSSVISFTETTLTKDFEIMKMTLDVSFQLLFKNLTPVQPRKWFCCFI